MKNISQNNEEESFFNKFKLWKNSWVLLSALMNAISLINVGADLKVVIFKWLNFFRISFDFTKKIAEYFLSPFIWMFSYIQIVIPEIIKNVFFFGFLLLTTYFRARKETNQKFGIGYFYSEKAKKFKHGNFVQFLMNYIALISMGFLSGICFASITWIGYSIMGNSAIYIIFSLIALLFLNFAFEYKPIKPENTYFRKLVKFYIISVLAFVFLICLTNYFVITFTGG